MMNQTVTRQSVNDILIQMDLVIERCIRERSKLGYFAVLYRSVTVQVRDAIKANHFEDGERMERLVVCFANRYLEAINKFWLGEKPSLSWSEAFRSASLRSPVILQHLMLGINAHINLDLAIASAQTAPGPLLPELKNDFQKIMDLLGQMIDSVEERIEKVSPYFGIIDRIGGRTDEYIAGFAIKKARDLAWNTAEKLAIAGQDEFKRKTDLHDLAVSLIAKGISKPPGFRLRSALMLVRLRELNDVAGVIETLKT
jgi:hypothetical protein